MHAAGQRVLHGLRPQAPAVAVHAARGRQACATITIERQAFTRSTHSDALDFHAYASILRRPPTLLAILDRCYTRGTKKQEPTSWNEFG